MSANETREGGSRRARAMFWSAVVIVVLTVSLPLTGYLATGTGAVAETGTGAFTEEQATNPRSDTWRGVRGGEEGFTTSTGPYTSGVLISNIGENWRQLREGPIKTAGGVVLGLAVLALAAVYLLRGPIRLENGRSRYWIPRWNSVQRAAHWVTAITFILLAVTGLSLLYGRHVVAPLLGDAGFAAYAEVAMYVHNFVGPVFALALVVLIATVIRYNAPKAYDLQWLKQGGGLFGGHPPAGRANAGEKGYFWLGPVLLGTVVVITGLILVFPQFGQGRELMAWSHVFHALGGLFFMALVLGHAYLGTIGQEGVFETMATGKADLNLVREHHPVWYEELQAQGMEPQPYVRGEVLGSAVEGPGGEEQARGGTG